MKRGPRPKFNMPINDLKDLYDKGLTYKEIAVKLGTDKTNINRFITRNKMSGRGISEHGKFVSSSARKKIIGDKHPSWKGGISTTAGYVVVKEPGKKYIYQHRKVMQEHLGRTLLSSEIIHHINHNKKDNRIENLEIMNRSSHQREHHVKNKYRKHNYQKLDQNP